jgi:hypothetical protein
MPRGFVFVCRHVPIGLDLETKTSLRGNSQHPVRYFSVGMALTRTSGQAEEVR